jgi:hypothetical protein
VKTVPALFLAALFLVAAIGSAAPDDFNGVVDGLEHHYGIHGHRLPMMGFASLCARVVTNEGVKGVRIAQFENVSLNHDRIEADDMTAFIADQLGAEWQPVVRDHERHGKEQTVIFVRPEGSAMRMLIADYDGNELDVVRVELDGAELARWINHMDDPTRRSRQQ